MSCLRNNGNVIQSGLLQACLQQSLVPGNCICLLSHRSALFVLFFFSFFSVFENTSQKTHLSNKQAILSILICLTPDDFTQQWGTPGVNGLMSSLFRNCFGTFQTVHL